MLKFHKRRKSREQALQAIYSWLLANHSLLSLKNDFFVIKNKNQYDYNYFEMLLYGIIKNIKALNLLLSNHLSRDLSKISLLCLEI